MLSCDNGDVIASPDGGNDAKKLGKLSKFRISKVTRKMLKERGVKQLFPIQYLSFDSVYDGKDLIGQARELSLRRGSGCEVCVGGGMVRSKVVEEVFITETLLLKRCVFVDSTLSSISVS